MSEKNNRFKQLTEAEIKKCLNGIPDIISPKADKEREKANGSICPSCGSVGGALITHPKIPFLPNAILPNLVVRCGSCQTVYDKASKIITESNGKQQPE